MNEKYAVAVVGIGCRLPGGVSRPDDLLNFLRNNGDGIIAVPPDRWSTDRFVSDNHDAPGRAYVAHGGFLRENVFEFDPNPFGLSPREVEYLDPQQRLLLEAAYDAVEDSGNRLSGLKGSNTGVYIGAFNVDLRDIVSLPVNRRYMSAHTATGTSHTVLSNRLSYTFDFHGPSFTVDTACSSSLVTVHYACRDLLDGVTDLALAGGVNAMLSPVSTAIMCKGHFLAADGRSKAFDAAADGYGRGEGVGIVVLKRLADAKRDGDRIYSVILASGVNQDGRTDGMPMPNGDAQAELCRSVVERAGIDPLRVGYVEAHGTGTRAGDPIEVRALASVYCGEGRTTPLSIGSVKTNVGHLEAAAGVTGLIKATLSLYAGRILPLRHLGEPNPDIPFEDLQVRVPVVEEAWPEGADLVAGVNSFGYGGTNAHAVLRAPQGDEIRRPALGLEDTREARVAAVSAFDDAALRARAEQLLGTSDLAGATSLLANEREQLPVRALVWGSDEVDLRDALGALSNGAPHPRVVTGKASNQPRILFVYTGMGPQWWGMGRELLENDAVFRAAADEVDRAFIAVSGWSIVAEMLKPEAESRMRENAVAQPANFVLQVALSRLLAHNGVRAGGYLGHSVGELAAAWASGCLDLETATLLAFHRSDIQQQVAGRGTMAALGIPLAEAEAFCARIGDLSVAAINGAQSVALAGGPQALEQVVAEVAASNRFARMMQVEVAYHSHHMDELRDAFSSRLAAIRGVAPSVPLYSTARGSKVEQASHDAVYWWENARNPVLLRQTLELALRDGYDMVLEIGPHPVLAEAIGVAAREAGVSVQLAHTQRRKVDAEQALMTCLGHLYTNGLDEVLRSLIPTKACSEPLPYPYQRRYYWFEPEQNKQYRLGRPDAHPILDQKLEGVATSWTVELAGDRFRWIADHQVQGTVVFPGAGYIEAALAVSAETFGEENEHVIENLEFISPLVFAEEIPPTLQLTLDGSDLSISSQTGAGSSPNANARISGRSRFAPLDKLALGTSADRELAVATLYEDFQARGLVYGPAFRCIEQIQAGEGRVVATLTVPKNAKGYWVFPGTLDSAFQALLALLPASVKGAVVPVRAAVVRCFKRAEGRLTMVGTAQLDGTDLVADFNLYDSQGEPVLSVDRLVCRQVNRGEAGGRTTLLHEKQWQAVAKRGPGVLPGAYVVIGDTALSDALEQRGGFVASDLQSLGNAQAHVVFILPRETDPTGEYELNALVLLIQELTNRSDARLTVLTHGAYSVNGEQVDAGQSALLGLTRVAMTEFPELDARIVDVELDEPLPVAEICDLFASDWSEEEVALRHGEVWALRLNRVGRLNQARRELRRAPEAGEKYELFSERAGRIDSLCYRPRHFPQLLAANEVEVEISAASLNFKDVMKALGMLDEVALDRTYLGTMLGLDAAGLVTAVGSGVSEFKAGDLVFVFAPGCLASHARVDERFVVHAARGHSPADACTYCVFQTVWYGLVQRAGLERGEKILIHSAAGGVGLAAIQLAQHLGAEIFATAGTEEKRQFLREMGIAHVYDSRTLDFSKQVLADTAGMGVDVVLNSLAGEAFLHNIQVLAPGGRFVELGKQAISKSMKFTLLPFNRAISLIAVDMDRMAAEKPDYYKPVARAVCAAFDSGIFRPLPTVSYPADDAVSAFRALASGGHIGKIVLDFSKPVAEVAPGLAPRPLWSPHKTYLVVGGLGGFGLRTAQWMVAGGARNLVLASRRGQASAEDELHVQGLRSEFGAAVETRALDVTDADAVQLLVDELASRPAPLGGVIHSAMVLYDVPLGQLNYDSIAQVMRPKALGAWNLHLATAHLPLDCFVMYSSVSALVGNPGQGAYAAANSFLDGLAAHRRALGLAALSIQWGAIAEVGVVSRDNQVDTHLRSIGLTPIAPDQGLEELGIALEEGFTDRGIIDIDWARWMRTTPDTRWNRLQHVADAGGQQSGRRELFAKEIEALPEDQREVAVASAVAAAVAPIFKLLPEAFEMSKSLKDYGMDSLMALEVQVALEENLGVEMSTMELLAGRSVQSLALAVLKRVSDGAEVIAPSAAVRQGTTTPEGDLAEYFLARICVQRPYFALREIAREGDWLVASAQPTRPMAGEGGPVSLAEAARHTAILGSCAARLLDPREGRIYYPVRTARLIESDNTVSVPLSEVEVRARAISYDAKSSLAYAEARLVSRQGQLICAFEIGFHVIPEAQFEVLFSKNFQPTVQAIAQNPYEYWRLLPALTLLETGAEVVLGEVDAANCLGHFVNYPAYPVSMMARDATSAVVETLRRRMGWPKARIQTVGGTAGTTRFVFAGEELKLVARHVQGSDEEQTWRVSFEVDGEECAWFEMDVVVDEASGSLQSTLVGPAEDTELIA